MFLGNVFAARLLSQELFGQFAMVRSTVVFLEGMISGSFSSAATKSIAQAETSNDGRLFFTTLGWAFVSTLFSGGTALALFLIVEDVVDAFFLGEPAMVLGLEVGAVLLMATGMSTFMQSVVVGLELFRRMAWASVSVSLVSIPIIYMALSDFGVIGGVAAVAVYFCLDAGTKLLIVVDKIQVVSIKEKRELFDVVNVAINAVRTNYPLLLAVITHGTAFWYARVLTVNSSGGFAEIAIFDAAFQWLTVIMLLSSSATTVALPMLAKAIHAGDGNAGNTLMANILATAVISVPLAVVFALGSSYAMGLYGDSYVEHSGVLVVLAGAAVLFAFATLFNRHAIAMGNNWLVFYVSFGGSVGMFLALISTQANSALVLAYSVCVYYMISVLIYLSTIRFRGARNGDNLDA